MFRCGVWIFRRGRNRRLGRLSGDRFPSKPADGVWRGNPGRRERAGDNAPQGSYDLLKICYNSRP